jgi:hypothetical protein
MWQKKDKGLLTVKSFKGNANELKRAKYILAFLQTGSIAYACKVSGLSAKAHSRIEEMFIQRGHAFDGQRSGRPVVYSDSQMVAAVDLLTGQEEGLLNGKQAHNHLVEAGSLHRTSAVQPFMLHLRKYVKGQGHQLITNSVKTTFFVDHRDMGERVAYAHTMLDILQKKGALDNLIFVDETTLEAVPHPKGMPTKVWSARRPVS